MSFMFSQELTAGIVDEESQSDSDSLRQETLNMMSGPPLPPYPWAPTMTGRTQPRPPTWINNCRRPVNLHQRQENREASRDYMTSQDEGAGGGRWKFNRFGSRQDAWGGVSGASAARERDLQGHLSQENREASRDYMTSQGEGAGGGRWKFNRFGSRQDAWGGVSGASAARERDLQGPLKELANNTDRLPRSMLQLLEESVKYLEARHKSNGEKMQDKILELSSRNLLANKPSNGLLQNVSGRLSKLENILKNQVENSEKLEQTRAEVERNMSDIVSGFDDNSNLLKSIEVLSRDLRRNLCGSKMVSLEQTKIKTESLLSAVVPSRHTSTPFGLMEQDDPPLVRRSSSALPGNMSLTPRFQQLNLVDGEEKTLLDVLSDTPESMEDEEW